MVAVILSVIAANQKTGHVHSPETAMAMQATSGGDFKQLDTAATMGVDLEEVAQTLATAGYRAESLAVTVASGVAQQLSPVQFVCLVFVGSFFFGRRLRR